MKSHYISNNILETEKIASLLYSDLKNRVIFLNGGLGAGKTAFVKYFAKMGGCNIDEVLSPTFTLLNIHNCKDTCIYHFDLYRLDYREELSEIGIYDIAGKNYTIFVEWASKFNLKNIFDKFITINIEILDTESRKFTITKNGEYE